MDVNVKGPDHASERICAGAEALKAADLLASLLGGLDASIGRLPTGPLRTMLRTTAADVRRALEDRG